MDCERIFLYVTHGQFNYGFGELGNFEQIFCTNSYRAIDHRLVTQFMVI